MAFLNGGPNKKQNQKARDVKQYRRITKKGIIVGLLIIVIGSLFVKGPTGQSVIQKFFGGSGNKTHSVLSKKQAGEIKVLLDAGHGGFDNGAKSEYTDKVESELNLETTLVLKEELENAGFQVELTRKDKNALGTTKNEDMKTRQDMIYKSDADITLSIHMNTHADKSVNGPIAFFMPGSTKGKLLSETIQSSMNDELEPKSPKSAQSQNFLVLRAGNMPCVLVECGFLTNKNEGPLLAKASYQKKVAQSITWGVMDYFTKES